MKQWVFVIIVGIFSLIGSGFLVISSIMLDGNAQAQTTITEEDQWYTIEFQKNDDDTESNRYVAITPDAFPTQTGSIVTKDLSRLVTVMFLSHPDTTPGSIGLKLKEEKGASGSLNEKNIIQIGYLNGIISLYDLFNSYTIQSSKGDFSLEQITNGSFYIGRTTTGKVVIYAIDGVARLTFQSNSQEMTSMVLFPGTYISFDPKRNINLRWADLFRVITTLDADADEVFEFVNPRINLGDTGDDVFIVYRLLDAKKLFRALTYRFREKIENLDLIESYMSVLNSDVVTSEPRFLKNPAKKNHNMLIELSGLLSQAVSQGADTKIIDRIADIYTKSKNLNLDGVTAEGSIRQFLLDGRFAIYSGKASADYRTIYEGIAEVIGVKDMTGKNRLLQNLSDIYSRNLFTQKKSSNLTRIDTFEPTAKELLDTISEKNIEESKDFFDIAIYAYNILKKVENSGMVPKDMLEVPSTYDYLRAFISAAGKYIQSINQWAIQSKTIESFSTQFYEKLLSTIVNSLFRQYVEVGPKSTLVFRDQYISNGPVDLAIPLVEGMRDFTERATGMLQLIESIDATADAATKSAIKRIRKSTLRLQWFLYMGDPANDRQYGASPYLDDPDEPGLPLIDNDLGTLRRKEVNQEIMPVRQVQLSPVLQNAMKFFPDAPSRLFRFEDEDQNSVRVANAPYKVISKKTNQTNSIFVDCLILGDAWVGDISFTFRGRKILVSLGGVASMPSESFQKFLSDDLDTYIYTLGYLFDTQAGGEGEVTIHIDKNIIVIGNDSFQINN